MNKTVSESAAPRPWGLCDGCAAAPGLPVPGREGLTPLYHCPTCAVQEALWDAARAHLADLAAPIVGAWAHQWQAAGVGLEDLEEITQHLTGAWMNPESAQAYRLKNLRTLSRAHTPPQITRDAAMRATVCLDSLPALTAHRAAADGGQPYFIDDRGQACTLFPGVDTITLALPDGSRAVLFPKYVSETDAAVPAGYRVPADLWPHVLAALADCPHT